MIRIICQAPWTAKVSLELRTSPPEHLGISGPSGSGKSTLLQSVAGLLPSSFGRLEWDSEDCSSLKPEARGFGYLPQGSVLFPHLTVLENITFGLRVRRVSAPERSRLGQEWIEKMRLQGLAASFPATLSGGEAMRVALARALIFRPRLLLLDEPFAALDKVLHESLRSMLREHLKETPTPMLLVSHDAEDFTVLCDRVVSLGSP